MTKIIKMSLVAAVAVAGLTTTSSAAKLADAIQNTDLTGYVRYRYTNPETDEATNQYRIQATVKSKVNDNVTAKIKLRGQGTTTETSGDADPVAADIQEANFVMNLGGATVIAGKQSLATPFADPDDQQGTGIVAVKPLGAVTIAGGFYTNSDAKSIYSDALTGDTKGNDIGGNSIAALAVIGKAAMVNYAVWYANIADESLNITDTTGVNGSLSGATAGADAINLNLKAAFGAVNVEFNTASVDYTANAAAKTAMDNLGTKVLNPTQTRLVVSSKVSKLTVAAGMIVVGKDGGDVTLGDTDAKSNFLMEAFSGSILKDTNAYYLMASAPVGPVTAKLEYGVTPDADGSSAAAGDQPASETKLSVAYAMSKNFNISTWATSTSGVLNNNNASRIEVKYTF